MNIRADQLLVQRGLASTRAQAQRLIASGVQWLKFDAYQKVQKNGDMLPSDCQIELLNAAEARYVSRGGLKLEGALQFLKLDINGATCLDVGQSTGGFTDCLLQAGAQRVVGVDVGFGQLHDNMRNNERVLCLERLNAREPYLISQTLSQVLRGHVDEDIILHPQENGDVNDHEHWDDEFENNQFKSTEEHTISMVNAFFPVDFEAQFDIIVGDLSFISQTLVLPALLPLLKKDGHLLMLVKPQFELNFGQVGKGGIVKDTALHEQVKQRITAAYTQAGLHIKQWLISDIQGGDGNIEFFVFASKNL